MRVRKVIRSMWHIWMRFQKYNRHQNTKSNNIYWSYSKTKPRQLARNSNKPNVKIYNFALLLCLTKCRVGTPLTGLIPPQFVPVRSLNLSWSCLSSVKMMGDCFFCWYWWKWWLSLFKLYFHERNMFTKGLCVSVHVVM